MKVGSFGLIFIGLNFVLLAHSPTVMAREYTVRVLVQDVSEIYDLADTDELPQDDLELLVALFNRPMDLNRADRYALYDLPGLSWQVVDAIIDHRNTIQGFVNVEDLRDVPGLSEMLYESIKPFIKIEKEESLDESTTIYGKARFGLAMERGLGDDLRQTTSADRLPGAYLSAEAMGFDYFGAGLQLAMRPLVSPFWDEGNGYFYDEGAQCDSGFAYACPAEHVDLAGAYLTFEKGIWRVIAGTYNVGFGQGVVFDTTKKSYPRGWERRLSQTIDRDDGAVRPEKSLRGLAVRLDGVDTPMGWIDFTLFASHQDGDLYRDDLRYAGDPDFQSASCTSDKDCLDGYTCREDNQCYSTRVYEYPNEGSNRQFQYHTFQDAFNEMVVGGDFTFNFGEDAHVGVTAYRSHTSFNYPDQSSVSFALGAAYPFRDDFGALGVHGHWHHGNVDLFAETAFTHQGDPAAVIQAVFKPTDLWEIDATGRYYHRDFDNPHSRSQAASIETFGSRQRNQRGLRLRVSGRPLSPLRTITDINLFDRTYQERYIEGALSWLDEPLSYLRFRQRFSYQITSKEAVGIQFDYNNNDLSENGRQDLCQTRVQSDGTPDDSCGFYVSQSLENSIDPISGQVVYERDQGRGERFRIQTTATTRRFLGFRLSLKYVHSWVDSPEDDFENAFSQEHYLRLALSGPLWSGARVTASGKYWFKQSSSNSDDHLLVYGGLSQRFAADRFDLSVFYGISGVARSEGFDVRHFATLSFGTRF
jgi:hypothetical protein